MSNRKKRGQSLVELCAGLIVAVPILLALLDCGVLLIGAAENDAACRDAARAAAGGPPVALTPGARTASGASPPFVRAQATMDRIYNLGIPAKIRDDELYVAENIDSVVGNSINGSVTVSSTMDVYPPFILGVVTRGRIPLKSSHSYPYTYVPPLPADS